MTEDDELNQQMSIWLDAKRMEGATKYAEAGRSLEGLATAELKQRWSETLVASSAKPLEMPEMTNLIDSELFLRGEKSFSMSEVPEAWEAIRSAMQTAYEAAREQPARIAEMGRSVQEEMGELFDRDRRRGS